MKQKKLSESEARLIRQDEALDRVGEQWRAHLRCYKAARARANRTEAREDKAAERIEFLLWLALANAEYGAAVCRATK